MAITQRFPRQRRGRRRSLAPGGCVRAWTRRAARRRRQRGRGQSRRFHPRARRDPHAVEQCRTAGLGSAVTVSVGGKTDELHGKPVSVRGTVRHLDDGRFEDTGVTHGGFRYFNAGARALVHTEEDQFILLTSRPMGNTSRAELTSAGLDPLSLRVIVAKGVHSPRGAFEPIAAEMIQLNTPGCTSADLSTLAYVRRRRPMFPFEQDAEFVA
ncbi:MAG: hypothetical protein EBT38_00250 [Acidimicrobiia bacterium]|nr:hypothetical protein [Acidimicrobiia bacterium]